MTVAGRIITARFRCRFRIIKNVQCSSPNEISAIEEEKDGFYKQLFAFQRFPKGDIVMVKDDLSAKMSFDNKGRGKISRLLQL